MPEAQATQSWWDDVQHLRPGAAEAAADRGAASARPGSHLHLATEADLPAAKQPAAPAPRRSRAAAHAEPRLSRAHAAGFADALDIDGAFGGRSRRFDRAIDGDPGTSRDIVLERDYEDDGYDTYDDHVDEPRMIVLEGDVDDEPAAAPIVRRPLTPEASMHRRAERTRVLPGNELATFAEPDAAPAVRRVTGHPERPRRSTADRVAARPDRLALYAVLLGLFLVLVAVVSAHP
jgi:hypothetical protein